MPRSLFSRPRRTLLLPDGAVVVGQSAGSWDAIAYDSQPHPKVAAFVVMPGGQAMLEQPGPHDGDGHRLFFGPGGSAVWGPMVERYLAQRGA